MNTEDISQNKNIILTGMPASGKSTIGVILAKVLGMSFLDTDLLIQQRENALLCEIIKDRGVSGFLKSEEEAILSVNCENTIIATGGSAVYSDAGMKHLKENGKVIYLKVEREDLFKRLHDIKGRGVVLRDNESLEEMYESRIPLYEKYADEIVEETNLSIEDTVERIAKLFI